MKLLSPLIATFLMLVSQMSFGQSFTFVALGDMPYSIPGDFERYERLIDSINQAKPSFSIFIGDSKSGASPCSDEYNLVVKKYFDKFKMPLIYSIGDNEWTDCHRVLAGSYDPLERLQALRSMFFSDNRSQGQSRIQLHRQSDLIPQFSAIVENSYWIKNNFLFVNLHIPGSNNNFDRNEEAKQEYFHRNQANLAWIDYVFQVMETRKLSGIILAYQADMFYSPKQASDLSSGYRDTLLSLTKHSQNSQKPVLLIHGDTHRLKIDQPLLAIDQKYVLENVMRLQVMGADQVQAVEISVQPKSEQPFSFKPLILKSNSPYKK